jgi:hypothetical protein
LLLGGWGDGSLGIVLEFEVEEGWRLGEAWEDEKLRIRRRRRRKSSRLEGKIASVGEGLRGWEVGREVVAAVGAVAAVEGEAASPFVA